MKKINVSAYVNLFDKLTEYKGTNEEYRAELAGKEAAMRSKIDAAIAADVNQPRRSERKADARAAIAAVRRVNELLCLPVKDRAGIHVTYRVGGGAYPACYTRPAMGDVLYFEHDGKAWYLVEACREDVKNLHVCDVWMSDAHKVKDFDARVKHGV